MKNKNKAFTLVEILAVIVVLGILTTVIITAISGYMQKGKDEYDESLEKQLLLSGKNYFADNSSLLPENGETSYVTLAQLRGLNIVSKDFIDAYGTTCSNKDSLVRVSNDKGKYTYKACLVCEGNDKFQDNNRCDPKTNEVIPDDANKSCVIEKNSDNGYVIYGRNGNKTTKTSEIEAVEEYKNGGCGSFEKCETNQISLNDSNNYINYWVNNSGKIVNKDTYDSDKVCNKPPLPSCSFKINDSTTCNNIITKNKISNEDEFIYKYTNSLGEDSLATDQLYYKYCMKSTTFDAIKNKKDQKTKEPSYVSNGSTATTTNYFYEANKSKLVKSSTASYIKYNKAIPSEYNFLIGKPEKVTYSSSIPSSIKMSQSNIKKWGSEYSNQVNGAIVVEANKNAINNYNVRYSKVGKYNGEYVDVVMTLTGYSGCKLRKGASVCGLWFESDKLGVYSLGIHRISIKYSFYKTGTNTPITVKGYTTYWDIDANQGIHFVQNTTGLYVYGANKLYVRTLNKAPYVYEYNDDLPIGYNGGYAITETFYGSSMKKTFTFASGNDGDHSKITGSSGEIWHSTYPIGITKSYSSISENSVFEKGQTITFILRYSNATEKAKTVKVTDTLKGMTYVSGSAKDETGTKVKPSVSGSNLIWSGTIGAFKTKVITYQVKVNDDSCGGLVETNAKMVIDGATYSTDTLKNAVACSEILKCK